MQSREKHMLQLAFIVAAVVFGCLGFVKFVFWQSNRISPEFFSAARTAYHLVRECDDRVSEVSAPSVACVKKAQDSLALLRETAKTHHERMEYAELDVYLTVVNDCHRDWQVPAESPPAKTCHEQLALFRDGADKLFKNSTIDATQQ